MAHGRELPHLEQVLWQYGESADATDPHQTERKLVLAAPGLWEFISRALSYGEIIRRSKPALGRSGAIPDVGYLIGS